MEEPILPENMAQTFRIESELGAGGSGAVYKAWHSRLEKHVVIKEIKHSSSSDIETRRNEVEALKNVKNAYVPQVFDFLIEGDRAFTVMEFIEGESFDKILGRGQKFTHDQVVVWYRQLASALEAIHKQNVCHRDIKPANIMLTPGGHVYLIDFNAAVIGDSGTRLVSRSLGYASPEQYDLFTRLEKAKNEFEAGLSCSWSSDQAERYAPVDDEDMGAHDSGIPDSDFVLTQIAKSEGNQELPCCSGILGETPHKSGDSLPGCRNPSTAGPPIHRLGQCSVDWKRSDIYSLGATMYHLLTNKRPPKRAGGIVCVLEPARFNRDIVRIIERSMRSNPMERYASATALANELYAIGKQDKTHNTTPPGKAVALIITIVLAALLRRRKHRHSR